MSHYFFDTRDGDRFVKDDVGIELPDLDSAKREATLSLAELARDVVAGDDRRILTVQVREGEDPVLEVRMTSRQSFSRGRLRLQPFER